MSNSTKLELTVEIETEKYQVEVDIDYLEHGLNNRNSRLFH